MTAIFDLPRPLRLTMAERLGPRHPCSARILNSRRTNGWDEWCYELGGVSEALLTAPEEDRQSKTPADPRGSDAGDTSANISDVLIINHKTVLEMAKIISLGGLIHLHGNNYCFLTVGE